jgi:alkylation response protein AidB-like acyl-CoA dehydrogenase
MDGGRTLSPELGLPWRGLADAVALAKDFATRAADHDREASFAFENIDALAQSGLFNLTVPAAFGGPERGLPDVAEVVGALAAGDASTALVFCMHVLQLSGVLAADRWKPELRARLARESLAGNALINALRVEPELGTPARGGLPATTATRVAEGWRIRGRKIYSTGSPALRYGLVWARTADEAPLVGMFLVPMASPGVRIEQTWDHLGLRASGSHDVVLEDVLVPHDHAGDIRPPEAWGPPDPLQQVWSNIAISALYDGIARAARDWLADFLRRRAPANLGAPLASLPRFQTALGEIEAWLLTNRMLIRSFTCGVTREATAAQADQAGLLKYTITGNAIAAVGRALELTGNPGLSRANPLERHYRDVLCSRVHTPQNDVLLLTAGRRALGL